MTAPEPVPEPERTGRESAGWSQPKEEEPPEEPVEPKARRRRASRPPTPLACTYEKARVVEADPLMAAYPGLYGRIHDNRLPTTTARLRAIASMVMAERPVMVVCLAQPKPHLRVLWGLQHIEPRVLEPTDVERAVLAFVKDVNQKRLPPSCQGEGDWLGFSEVVNPTVAAVDAAVEAAQPGDALIGEATDRDRQATVALLTIAPLFLVQPLMQYPYKTPLQACPLLRERARREGLTDKAAPFFIWLRSIIHPEEERLKRLSLVDLTNLLEDSRWETLLALLPACAQSPSGSVPVVINSNLVPQKPVAATGEGAPGKAMGGSKAKPATRWPSQVNGLCRLCNVAR
uniref:Uncharacterized protein n=1 Tax=Odontella aurita TaxID=265563 RepID=A0A6U6DM87_9STRA|mmetsp:Transcript_21377/g.62339  ORF Transcript_21377/g.62339 Transcript_21377/m.62339 type:complete len:345 (+) Transcript_21377:329-1363(+)